MRNVNYLYYQTSCRQKLIFRQINNHIFNHYAQSFGPRFFFFFFFFCVVFIYVLKIRFDETHFLLQNWGFGTIMCFCITKSEPIRQKQSITLSTSTTYKVNTTMLSLSLGVASRHEFASGVSRGTKCDTDIHRGVASIIV